GLQPQGAAAYLRQRIVDGGRQAFQRINSQFLHSGAFSLLGPHSWSQGSPGRSDRADREERRHPCSRQPRLRSDAQKGSAAGQPICRSRALNAASAALISKKRRPRRGSRPSLVMSADQADRLVLIGSFRTVLPVAARSALATAGPIGGTPGSPTPVGGSCDGTIWTSTCGIWSIRSGV